ncbi:FkbM family methyltransferase [Synechocystis sp. PCC 7338]|uniref:FkbM family methyltransferase n=1 Tax=Synechocystis sp. PCC 7338 TaxID=2732530 RepID=UPI001BAF50F0|nr:FkbM family methyltransferase [Synechocystis sp. PCC 7338]QUS59985.1 FkbM family methyltransferase [Synechocystis sp. PCC 7338]
MKIVDYLNVTRNILVHPSNRSNPPGALLRACSQYYKCIIKQKEISIPAFGHKLYLDPKADFTRSYIYYTAQKDYHMMNFVKRYLRPGDNFIDVGANIGVYSLLAASLIGDQGKVYAFEAVPITFSRLQKNITQNNLSAVIQSWNLAVADKPSTLEFTVSQDATNHVLGLNNKTTKRANNQTLNTVIVQAQRLDDILSCKQDYAMAKIDVEGYELYALKGAENLIQQKKLPVLMLEINNSFKRYGYSQDDIHSLLKAFGYESATYNAESNTLTFTHDVWDDVLFVSSEHKQNIQKRTKCHIEQKY